MSRVGDALAAGRTRLAESPTARLDAEILLAHALGKRRTWLHAWPEASLTPAERADYEGLLERRAAGEPVAYLLGEREFRSLALAVSPDVLIPRPETETLVDVALAHLRSAGPPAPAVLDLGTGSACVAIALAHERPDARVTAVDSAAAALRVARHNAERHGLVNVAFLQGAWYEPLCPRRFDLIVCNPPYVARGDPHLVRGDVRFEPVEALDGGPDGLDALRTVAAGALRQLEPGGCVAVEHGPDQGEAVAALFAAAGLASVEIHPDAAGLARVTSARAPG